MKIFGFGAPRSAVEGVTQPGRDRFVSSNGQKLDIYFQRRAD
jgi:hypothetical protein